ncbi:MAG: MBL fold metallo-hydrolase [Clostridia bacterium]|nr:MBL fold metallo-hydrolase [Clostridia bacterium]
MPRLYPLFSGSSGNCYYIGSAGSGILIDAGRSAKQIENALKENDLDIKNVRAVFVTHEHIDHVKGLRVLASRHGLKVYASEGTVEALREKDLINEKVDIMPIGFDGKETDDMKIRPFEISHDCAQGFGFVVETSDGRKTAFATDTGYVTDSMSKAIRGCDTAVIESNHDVRMLENGLYPYLLKRRILSDIGHLSNDVCAETVTALVKSGSTRFVLAHLSKENNMPELARQTSLCTLEQNGMKQNIDFMLTVAAESNNKPLIY